MENLKLKAITHCDQGIFDKTEYQGLTKKKRIELISRSIEKSYENKYFEFFLLQNDSDIVGLMNFKAHSDTVISVAPEIKEEFRGKGFATAGLKLAYNLAKEKGFKIAIADIREDNLPSIKLHEKLGFEYMRTYKNLKGTTLRLYLKLL